MTDKYAGPERRGKNGNGVTWKWIAGALMGLSSVIGAAWLNANTGEIASLKVAQKQADTEQSKIREKAGVIEEKVRRIEEDVKDVKEQQKDTNRKLDDQKKSLDELLRRTK